MFRDRNKSIVTSYISLRRLIGILGMLLPLVCIVGACVFQGRQVLPSISYYYHSNMRDFFIGLMFAVSFFLLTYKGYEKIDNIVTSASGIMGMGLAVFPCLFDKTFQRIGIFQLDQGISDIFHVISAALFFILLGCNSLFLFTLSKKPDVKPGKNKRIRNFIFRVCGAVILFCVLAVIVLHLIFGTEALQNTVVVLVLEWVMLTAFGFSWLVKGETLFKDRESEELDQRGDTEPQALGIAHPHQAG